MKVSKKGDRIIGLKVLVESNHCCSFWGVAVVRDTVVPDCKGSVIGHMA